MKISADGGALCADGAKRFGTYYFSTNFIRALAGYDKKNIYDIYTFCKPKDIISGRHRNILYRPLYPTLGWMKVRVSLEEYLRGNDIFMALNQAFPLFTRARIFAWSHGLAYLNSPKLYPDSQSRLVSQLLRMCERAERIFVTSARVHEQILDYSKETPVHVVPIGVPYDMTLSKPLQRSDFFMFVGMNHPIKNIQFVIDCFLKLVHTKKYAHFKLLLATNTVHGLTLIHKNIQIVQPGRQELKKLYATSRGLLSASLYESFNLPILEALSQGCPVIALNSAVIPEFKTYVNVASGVEDFVGYMERAAAQKLPAIPTLKIHETFAWERIIKTVTSYY